VTPQPKALDTLWGLQEADIKAQSSRIIFVNGLNDGWSVGGIQKSLAPEKGLIAINLPNGAHHSELAHKSFGNLDTPDVRQCHDEINKLVGKWIQEIHSDVDDDHADDDKQPISLIV